MIHNFFQTLKIIFELSFLLPLLEPKMFTIYQSAISFEPTHAHNVHLNFTPTDDVLFISKRFKSFFNFYNLVKSKLFSNLIKWPKDSYVKKVVLNVNWIPKVAFYVEMSMSQKIYFILFYFYTLCCLLIKSFLFWC